MIILIIKTIKKNMKILINCCIYFIILYLFFGLLFINILFIFINNLYHKKIKNKN